MKRCFARFRRRSAPALIAALEGDPRPAYQHDPTRVYGFLYAGFDVRFTVEGDTLTVVEILRQK